MSKITAEFMWRRQVNLPAHPVLGVSALLGAGRASPDPEHHSQPSHRAAGTRQFSRPPFYVFILIELQGTDVQ